MVESQHFSDITGNNFKPRITFGGSASAFDLSLYFSVEVQSNCQDSLTITHSIRLKQKTLFLTRKGLLLEVWISINARVSKHGCNDVKQMFSVWDQLFSAVSAAVCPPLSHCFYILSISYVIDLLSDVPSLRFCHKMIKFFNLVLRMSIFGFWSLSWLPIFFYLNVSSDKYTQLCWKITDPHSFLCPACSFSLPTSTPPCWGWGEGWAGTEGEMLKGGMFTRVRTRKLGGDGESIKG